MMELKFFLSPQKNPPQEKPKRNIECELFTSCLWTEVVCHGNKSMPEKFYSVFILHFITILYITSS